MTTPPLPNPGDPVNARIDAYLDGSGTPEQRAAFEREVAADPTLRAEVELQRRIDDRLRVVMAPPAAPAASSGALNCAEPNHASPRWRFPAWLKAAAAIALVALGVWAVVARPWESLLARPPSVLAVDAVMKRFVVDEGYKPIWVCDTDEKFAAYTQKELGVPLIAHPDSGVQLVGWAYTGGLLADDVRNAQVLMAMSGDAHVLVVMGPRGDDRTLRTDPGSNLHIHKREYRGLVMYEISPLDHPVVLSSVAAK